MTSVIVRRCRSGLKIIIIIITIKLQFFISVTVTSYCYFSYFQLQLHENLANLTRTSQIFV